MASEFPNTPSGLPPQPPIQPTPPPPGAPSGGIVGRIQRLLLSPRAEWTAIDREPINAKALFLSWAVPLAAIGPVCGLIGGQIFGININAGIMVVHATPALVPALIGAVILYALGLAGTWLFAMIIDALALNFASTKNFDQAMKVVVFSYTATWLAGVFQLVPGPVALIGSLLGLYSLYLLWIGLPILMKTPSDKAPSYVIVSILAAIVVFAVVFLVAGAIIASLINASLGQPTVGAVTFS